ncbi:MULTISPECIES: type IV secretory system conjugative DNA transfer family protein [unclassified Acinetobacter]|uniref:type IV secretory system conjugative DNA transfer family protein n=1 Tax=unclassified Acinetobacter TaxID=196816 RepID=UPI0029343D8C|nr:MULTISPECIES: type IV secretion system DNA-binding domain-containing protein [unclassified Acinetobacter]WOE33365.1 type IV secretion system DNA-binding domain-containing protein [Acinetobacter sp. SAAs470]WOE36893.1 type IV secretion system DNA-binding domain-containing protein [Acinetobacter sp. SAAs474]
MLHNFFMSYYGYLINGLHLKPLFVGFANTLFALAIIVIFTMIVVGIKKIYKAHDPVYEIGYNIVLLAVVVLAHTYLLSYITNLLSNNYVVVPEKNYFFSWAVIIGLYVYLYFTGKKSKPRVERIKKESAEGYGTLLSELKRGFENKTPLIAFTDQTLPKKRIKEMEQKYLDWSFHRESLRVTNEDRGIVLGAPGSGKTTFLISQIVEWMKSGRSFVATDVKPEIWAILKANNVFKLFGYKDWVFNPTDVASDHYNIFSEVKDSAELNEILNIIIKDDTADSVVFNDLARRILKAVLIELGDKASLVNAQNYINSMDSNDELLKALRQSEKSSVSNIAKEVSRTAQNDRLLASVMTAVSKAFEFLDDDRIRATTSDNAQGFYLKEVLMQPKQAVFLQFDQQYKSSTATLFGAMVAHTMRILQANQNREAVFIALDEIINCAPIPKFTDLLNTIRSANMPTFLYLQSLEGLNRLYGANSDKMFMGSSNLKIVFRIGDIESAEECSRLVGQTETTYISETAGTSQTSGTSSSSRASSSSSNRSQNVGTTKSIKLESIIEPAEFIKLPICTAVVMYNGSYGTLEMPKYYECYNMPKRTNLKTIRDFKVA